MKYVPIVFCFIALVFLCGFGLNCIYGIMFPMKYKEEILAAAETCNVEQSIIYSIINVESGFDKEAISSKGAVGLMQLMPSTAQEVAEKIGIKQFELKEAKDNIMLGTKYFDLLLKKFGEVETALAGYNAGPSNVSAWLKKTEYSDDGKTLKKIPFPETERYIQKFKRSYNYYSKRLKY